MTQAGKRRGVLIIGDTKDFGRVIRATLEPKSALMNPVRDTTYDDFRGLLTPRVIKETALFVIELWRNYPTGLRAEGLAVAEQLIRVGATPLIISPLAIGHDIDAPFYWDLGSSDSLPERATLLLKRKDTGSSRWAEPLSHLHEILQQYLGKPVSHGDPAR